MVVRLWEKLDIPLRDRNILLVAGGFAPNFPERALIDPSLAAVWRAIDSMLVGLEPSPAFAIDRHWTLLKTNEAGNYLLKMVDACLLEPPVNFYVYGLTYIAESVRTGNPSMQPTQAQGISSLLFLD